MTAPTALTPHQISDTPLTDPVDGVTDATNGNSFVNSGVTMMRINNTSGSQATITFSPLDATEGLHGEFAVGGEQKTIASAGIVWVGRRDLRNYGRNVVFKTSVSTLKVTIFEP